MGIKFAHCVFTVNPNLQFKSRHQTPPKSTKNRIDKWHNHRKIEQNLSLKIIMDSYVIILTLKNSITFRNYTIVCHSTVIQSEIDSEPNSNLDSRKSLTLILFSQWISQHVQQFYSIPQKKAFSNLSVRCCVYTEIVQVKENA